MPRARQPDEALIGKLILIGSLKNALPFTLRGCVNKLGLYVQIRRYSDPPDLLGVLERYKDAPSLGLPAKVGSQLLAGGKWIPKIVVSFEVDLKTAERSVHVHKYVPGNWEALAEPTLEIVSWIIVRGEFTKAMGRRLEEAVKRFRQERRWQLLTYEEQIAIRRRLPSWARDFKGTPEWDFVKAGVSEFHNRLQDTIGHG
jgi:hypothetical protein